MKYYEMHEKIYLDLEKQGKISWDKHSDLSAVLGTHMNKTLGKYLIDFSIDPKGLAVLDLGTGTGNCALFCSSLKAQVTGIDASGTAIKLAKKNAQDLGLSTLFFCEDILKLKLNQKFDLITDSSLLHCLIGHDREKFYQTVRSHLNSEGCLFIHTMVKSQAIEENFDPKYFKMKGDILWSLGMSEVSDRQEFEGKSYFPHRTILSEKDQLQELVVQGFSPLAFEIKVSDGNPNLLTGLFKFSHL